MRNPARMDFSLRYTVRVIRGVLGLSDQGFPKKTDSMTYACPTKGRNSGEGEVEREIKAPQGSERVRRSYAYKRTM